MSNVFNGYQEVGVTIHILNAKSNLILDPPYHPSLATVTVKLRCQNCSYINKTFRV